MKKESFELNETLLVSLKNRVEQSKQHIELLAASSPEIRANLASIAESLQTVSDRLTHQIYINRHICIAYGNLNKNFHIEKACKNQAYDFIATEKHIGSFKVFCENYPMKLYLRLSGHDIICKQFEL